MLTNVVLAIVIAAAGETATGLDEQPDYIQLEVGNVRVATKRPGSDEPWKTVTEGSGGGACGLISKIPILPNGLGLLCDLAQSGSKTDAHLASAPDLFVRVAASNASYRSYVVRRTFAHNFRFQVLVPTHAVPRTGLVVEVLADDGKLGDETKESIGSFRYNLPALLTAGKEGKILGATDGGVEKLELIVELAERKAAKGKVRLNVADGMQLSHPLIQMRPKTSRNVAC